MSTLMSGLKKELAGMFHSLEKSIKKEITAVRSDMSHILVRVEETEQRQDTQAVAIKDLQDTVTQLAFAYRASMYKLEDLENRNRRNNIRVRGLPEATGDSDLEPSIRGIFNSILGNPVTAPLCFDRVHRALRPRIANSDLPRDVICRLHYLEDKNAIMTKMRGLPNIDFDGATITIYPDLSKDTLDRRRTLKPLLDHLRSDGITYRWGFPACLIATKKGRSHTLRFPEELPTFLQDLHLSPIELPGWQDPIPKFSCPMDSSLEKDPLKQRASLPSGICTKAWPCAVEVHLLSCLSYSATPSPSPSGA
ncbi:hypothetical protein AB205_0176850, partial [Aquarana catesbeiana]